MRMVRNAKNAFGALIKQSEGAMRLSAILAVLATPAAAWEFTPTPICTLTHETEAAALRITYDSTEYVLTLTLKDGTWAPSPGFEIRFDGRRPLTISTDRHALGGPELSVTDRGFGNVLDGLQFNDTATAFTDGQAITIPLQDAAEPVAAFRRCPAPATS